MMSSRVSCVASLRRCTISSNFASSVAAPAMAGRGPPTSPVSGSEGCQTCSRATIAAALKSEATMSVSSTEM